MIYETVLWGWGGVWTDNAWSFPKHVNTPVLTYWHPDTDNLMVTAAATWQLLDINGPNAVNTQKNTHCMYGCDNTWLVSEPTLSILVLCLIQLKQQINQGCKF